MASVDADASVWPAAADPGEVVGHLSQAYTLLGDTFAASGRRTMPLH
ncbi:hypothetical protein OHU23_40665 (plasmid) [Streptomyces virginiae]